VCGAQTTRKSQQILLPDFGVELLKCHHSGKGVNKGGDQSTVTISQNTQLQYFNAPVFIGSPIPQIYHLTHLLFNTLNQSVAPEVEKVTE